MTVWEALGAELGQVQQGSGEGSGGLGSFGAKPGQVQQGSEEGSEEGLGGFGAEPGQIQEGSGKGSGEGLGGFCESQVKFNRVPEKVPEKVCEALVQSQVRFNRVPEKVPEKVCEAWVQTQLKYFQRLASQHASERFVICKNKTLRLLGTPPKLMFVYFFFQPCTPLSNRELKNGLCQDLNKQGFHSLHRWKSDPHLHMEHHGTGLASSTVRKFPLPCAPTGNYQNDPHVKSDALWLFLACPPVMIDHRGSHEQETVFLC